MDFDARLVVAGRREDFRLAARDGGVAVDEFGRHAAQSFDAQGQRGDVEQQDSLDFAFEHSALNTGTDCNDLVGVDALMGRLADQSTGCFDNPRHAGHASNQHQFVDLLGRNAGVAQTGLSRGDRALEEGVTQLLHLGAGKLQGDVLRTGSIGRDEGQVDLVLLGRGQCDLGLFGLFLNTLERIGLLAEINSLVFLEFGQDPVDDGVIPVVAAQVGIAVGGLHFEDTVADFQDGDIERAAAQVVHGDLFVFLFVETVSQRSCGGFVDNSEDF